MKIHIYYDIYCNIYRNNEAKKNIIINIKNILISNNWQGKKGSDRILLDLWAHCSICLSTNQASLQQGHLFFPEK